MLGRLLLSFMPAEAMGRLLLGTGYGLLAMIGLAAFYRLGRSERGSAARLRAAGYADADIDRLRASGAVA